jgi:DNA ligase-1
MDESYMQHGHHYSGQDVSGWVSSEKFDGVRAYWDGRQMWTRGGKPIAIPDSWRDALPAGFPLDGELYAGIGGQRKAASAARWAKFDSTMRFMAFDAPAMPGNWSDRMTYIRGNEIVRPVEFQPVEDSGHALEIMRGIQANGGEGIMLRHPALTYNPGRTDRMLKLKTACWH